MPSIANETSEAVTAAGGRQNFSVACLRSRPSVKLFVTDLDGTLLFPSLKVSQRAVAAFRRLRQVGVQCVIATGRPLSGAVSCIGTETLEQLQLPYGRPGVYMNGSVVVGKNGERLHVEYLSQEQAQKVVAVAEQHGWLSRVTGYSEDNIICFEEDPFTLNLHKNYGEVAPQVVSREVFQNTRLCKIAVNGLTEDLSPIRLTLEDSLRSTDVRVVAPIPCSLEVCPANATKAAGLRVLMQQFQVQPEEILAIGDSENDVEMLRFAGVSVAVGNATPDAELAATFVTCRCDEDAVAKAAECVAEVLEERQGRKGDDAEAGGVPAAAAKQLPETETAASPPAARSG